MIAFHESNLNDVFPFFHVYIWDFLNFAGEFYIILVGEYDLFLLHASKKPWTDGAGQPIPL